MTYRIDPNEYCTTEGCTRPKATGEWVCSQCSRLARATGSRELPSSDTTPAARQILADEPELPRCIAYLSMDGDVITLELTGEPRFTEADVEAVAYLLANRRQAA